MYSPRAVGIISVQPEVIPLPQSKYVGTKTKNGSCSSAASVWSVISLRFNSGLLGLKLCCCLAYVYIRLRNERVFPSIEI